MNILAEKIELAKEKSREILKKLEVYGVDTKVFLDDVELLMRNLAVLEKFNKEIEESQQQFYNNSKRVDELYAKLTEFELDWDEYWEEIEELSKKLAGHFDIFKEKRFNGLDKLMEANLSDYYETYNKVSSLIYHYKDMQEYCMVDEWHDRVVKMTESFSPDNIRNSIEQARKIQLDGADEKAEANQSILDDLAHDYDDNLPVEHDMYRDNSEEKNITEKRNRELEDNIFRAQDISYLEAIKKIDDVIEKLDKIIERLDVLIMKRERETIGESLEKKEVSNMKSSL